MLVMIIRSLAAQVMALAHSHPNDGVRKTSKELALAALEVVQQ
jgi:hypothetical protein